MGRTTHVAWLAEWPAGPSTVWTGMGWGLKGLSQHPTQAEGRERGWSWVLSERKETKGLAQANLWQILRDVFHMASVATTRTLH